ncbi:hypothetical protein VaNZ11_006522 [Volvox africanus]|uniref:histone acetyltransferase n=1 Tax=Volvox africanus TaxID=51714 RepID=A0ABQ5S1P5_9CHLO|nr:hypothetical protein VaNZ11_006522 [Volvox africanus]
MSADQEQPQAKRVRLSDATSSQQHISAPPQGAAPFGAQGPGAGAGASSSSTNGPSSTTGATVALPPTLASAPYQHHNQDEAKPSVSVALRPLTAPVSITAATAAARAAGSGSGSTAAPGAVAGSMKPTSFIADARETVFFRAVSGATADAITAEIAAGGKAVHVDFLHQHFGDSEQIRGYRGLKITIWIHVRTYHTWVDIQFAGKRPGADKLGPIFDGAFPSGYCRSQDQFVATAAAAAAAMPDLLTLGDCVGTLPLPPPTYGIKKAEAADSSGDLSEVSVRRFQVATAPPEVKALHARLEPLLLFTIDGAQFIDADDPQWELLLPVARAEDGGCLVLGLTTLFNFFAYPTSCRLRVSQVLVLSPWQGLGLGKALLKLSYDLAKSRRCADLTVEDPTPNLQRVREKLEVEMMRGLPWVVRQARKCLDAVARNETTWPGWEEAGSRQSSSTTGAPQPQPPAPKQEPKAAAAAAAEVADEISEGGEGGESRADTSVHPLLADHAFFAALGAAPLPNMSLPAAVHAEAIAAAVARWQQRAAAAEVVTADAVAVKAAGESGGGGVGEGEDGQAAATTAATTAAAALTPTPSFLNAICAELKMHRGQIRIVWEALLWCEADAVNRPGVRAAVEQLIVQRLESQHFCCMGPAAATKRLVEIPATDTRRRRTEEDKEHEAGGTGSSGADDAQENDLGTSFFMYRPVGQVAADNGSGSADTAVVATGRLNLTHVTVEDKARRMEEILQERRLQLESLAAVLSASKINNNNNNSAKMKKLQLLMQKRC